MRCTLTLAAVAALALPAAAMAQTSPIAVGANIGTPGVGGSVQVLATDTVVLRGEFDWLKFDRDEDYSDIEYSGKLQSTTAGIFADWHPGGGTFLVSGGAYIGTRKIDFDATPTTNVNIGGSPFTPAEVGRLDGRATMSKFQPFLGLGYDNTWVGDRAWGLRVMAGVSFSGKPDVDLTATGGTLAADPTFQQRLQDESADIREDAEKFRYYPVLQIGLTRRF